MPKLAAIIPSYIECVTILAHDDEAGQRGANSLAEALYQRRIEVIVEALGLTIPESFLLRADEVLE